MAEYKLFAEDKYDRHCGFYKTYGIIAYEDGNIARRLCDISVDRDKVERMVTLFNEEALSPAHLSIAVEDYLYDFEF